MLVGAIIGAVIGLIAGTIYALVAKGNPCPQCGDPLPVPWFRPPRQCPHCGCRLDSSGKRLPQTDDGRRVAGRSSKGVASLAIAMALAVIGVALPVLFLPGALESRRVWRHQQGRVDEAQREIRELERRPDPQSQARARQLREEFRKASWHPESHRDQYHTRLLFAAAGLISLGAAGLVFALRLRALGRSRR